MNGEDILKRLAEDAQMSVDSGYYKVKEPLQKAERRNLVDAFRKHSHSVMCEIKFASPSAGKISEKHDQVALVAAQMESGGASALSILTEKGSFKGSLENLTLARAATHIPIMMKDIIVSREQILAAPAIGADAVLLILELFEKKLTRISLDDALDLAHAEGLSVVVETYSLPGLEKLMDTDCDIVGINNRDLATFKVSVERTVELLKGLGMNRKKNALIMSESGYENSSDIRNVLGALNGSDLIPDAFLIGTSIMKASNVEQKVREFVQAFGGA
ncbi:MAG: indole-3-glycerol phosphate synthase TrpC [Nitrososphaerales archaeon]